MSWRKTLILAFILVIVGIFYFWDRHRIEEEKTREEEQKTIFPWRPDQLGEVTVERPSGRLRLVKTGPEGNWRIHEPVQTGTDPDRIELFLERLLEAKKEREIAEDPDDLGLFGLQEAEVVITIKGADPGDEKVLRIGKKNPTEVFYYAQLQGAKPVFLVYDTVRKEADREVFDIREKELWHFMADNVNEVHLKTKETSVTLRRRSEGVYDWEVAEPGPFEADGDGIQAFLFKLSRLRATAFVDHPEQPPSEMGLEPPERRVILRFEGQKEPLTIDFGREAPDDPRKLIYVRKDEGQGVAVVHPKSLADLRMDRATWRERMLIAFQRDEVERFEVRHSGETLSLRRIDANEWEIESPKKLPADFFQVNDFLWTIKDAKAESFLDEAPSDVSWDQPDLRISLWLKGQENPLSLLVSGPIPGGIGHYAKAPSQDGVVVIGTGLGEDLRVRLHDLRDRRLMGFEAPDIHRVEVIWGKKTLDLLRDGDLWRTRPPEKKEIEPTKISSLLWTIRDLRFEEELSQKPSPEALGMEKPSVQITLWKENGDRVGPLMVGKTADGNDGDRYAWPNEGSPIYLVKPKSLEDLKRDMEEISPEFFSDEAKS